MTILSSPSFLSSILFIWHIFYYCSQSSGLPFLFSSAGWFDLSGISSSFLLCCSYFSIEPFGLSSLVFYFRYYFPIYFLSEWALPPLFPSFFSHLFPNSTSNSNPVFLGIRFLFSLISFTIFNLYFFGNRLSIYYFCCSVKK